MCSRLKVLRVEENCLPLAVFTPRILRESPVSLLAVDGNVFDMKSFQALDGYDQVSILTADKFVVGPPNLSLCNFYV